MMHKLLMDALMRSERDVMTEGYDAKVLRENPSFNKAVAALKIDMMEKEDADSVKLLRQGKFEEANKLREMYSIQRYALDSILSELDGRISEYENDTPSTTNLK